MEEALISLEEVAKPQPVGCSAEVIPIPHKAIRGRHLSLGEQRSPTRPLLLQEASLARETHKDSKNRMDHSSVEHRSKT